MLIQTGFNLLLNLQLTCVSANIENILFPWKCSCLLHAAASNAVSLNEPFFL